MAAQLCQTTAETHCPGFVAAAGYPHVGTAPRAERRRDTGWRGGKVLTAVAARTGSRTGSPGQAESSCVSCAILEGERLARDCDDARGCLVALSRASSPPTKLESYAVREGRQGYPTAVVARAVHNVQHTRTAAAQ
jgi:hypothetical protein